MINIPEFLKRTASRSGFVRTKFVEKDIPDDHTKLAVMFFFGDIRSMFILSSLLLHRYQEEVKGSKYFILCTWPGFEGLFPYVDEYWGFKDDERSKTLFKTAVGFDNDSEWAFDKRVEAAEKKVVIYPVLKINRWKNGSLESMRVPEDFWISLCEALDNHGVTPVVYQNFGTHNLAAAMDGLFIADNDISKLLGAMRRVGCVLDVFSGISHLAIAARCPFIACDERPRFHGHRQDEIDGLCCEKSLPREYIFTFPTIINDGHQLWGINLFPLLLKKLESFMSGLNRETWPPTSESTEIVQYQEVKRKRMKKIGTRFIRVEGQHGQ